MAKETRLRVGAIREKEMDLLLLEECVANNDFRRWFVASVAAAIPVGDLLEATRSVYQPTGGMGVNEARIRKVLASSLEPDFQIVRASKSVAVRLQVPKLALKAAFNEQAGQAAVGLRAASRLYRWFRAYRSKIDAAISEVSEKHRR
jgi:hypothetical protein